MKPSRESSCKKKKNSSRCLNWRKRILRWMRKPGNLSHRFRRWSLCRWKGSMKISWSRWMKMKRSEHWWAADKKSAWYALIAWKISYACSLTAITFFIGNVSRDILKLRLTSLSVPFCVRCKTARLSLHPGIWTESWTQSKWKSFKSIPSCKQWMFKMIFHGAQPLIAITLSSLTPVWTAMISLASSVPNDTVLSAESPSMLVNLAYSIRHRQIQTRMKRLSRNLWRVPSTRCVPSANFGLRKPKAVTTWDADVARNSATGVAVSTWSALVWTKLDHMQWKFSQDREGIHLLEDQTEQMFNVTLSYLNHMNRQLRKKVR